jgi:phage recombination protein Bet
MTVNGTVALRDGYEMAQNAALAIRPGQEMFDSKQRAALSVLGIKDATNADLAVFMHYCQRTLLDPFSKQIYMIPRREKINDQWVTKQTIQTGIDGFRVIRDRVCARLGIEVEYEDTIWYDADGREHTVWLPETPPTACRVVVLKNGKRFPAVLRTAAYMAKDKNGNALAQWRTQPDHQIEKCCEAFALRRAFPNDLGGLYVDEEMAAAPEPAQQYQRVTVTDITAPAAAQLPSEPPDEEDQGEPYHGGPKATPRQVGTIQGRFREFGFTEAERDQRLAITATLAGLPGLDSTSSLRKTEAGTVIDKLAGLTDRDELIAELVKADQDASDG